jgi:hypothetical protein
MTNMTKKNYLKVIFFISISTVLFSTAQQIPPPLTSTIQSAPPQTIQIQPLQLPPIFLQQSAPQTIQPTQSAYNIWGTQPQTYPTNPNQGSFNQPQIQPIIPIPVLFINQLQQSNQSSWLPQPKTQQFH